MDIYEILGIWKLGAIGWTVSCLNRLFHAPQTRRGGGLRSQSASRYSMPSSPVNVGFNGI